MQVPRSIERDAPAPKIQFFLFLNQIGRPGGVQKHEPPDEEGAHVNRQEVETAGGNKKKTQTKNSTAATKYEKKNLQDSAKPARASPLTAGATKSRRSKSKGKNESRGRE